MENINKNKKEIWTILFFVALRIFIGWHFLYEGLSKVITPGWTSENYLINSTWVFADIFRWMSSNDSVLSVVDFLNMWGLVLAGLGLILGLFIRIASLGGVLLLSLYYVAYPPFIGVFQEAGPAGIYMIVNMNLIEMMALLLIFFSGQSREYGLDSLRLPPFKSIFGKKPGTGAEVSQTDIARRREVLKAMVSVPFVGAFALAFQQKHGWGSHEESALSFDGVSGATGKAIDIKGLDKLKGKIPLSNIKGLPLSRVIFGGNLIGGWAHARDLLYVSDLVKAYNTDDKVFHTLHLAEECGINTLITNPILSPLLHRYWKRGGKMQFISDGGWNFKEDIKKSIDQGAASCYVQGGTADILVKEGKFDDIAWALDTIRKNGLPAGIGSHELQTIKACVEKGLIPDYWMKTLHKTNYWSSRIDQERKTTLDEEFADNIFCQNPDEVIEFMEKLEQPWIAFKILGAGAIKPEDAFQWAFESGADFICVGMYDFQLIDNVNLAYDILSKPIQRAREWRA